jgi:hypothetical protein
MQKFRNFGIWLEVRSLTSDIMGHVSKSIEYVLSGQWTVQSAKKLMQTWRHQSYQKVRMIGRNVRQEGDIFEVFVSIYVYKKPRSTFDNLDKHAVYNPPDWTNDPSQWDDAEYYDSHKGSPVVDFHVTVRGDKVEEKSDRNVMNQPIYPYIGESDKDLGRRLRTPYEVAQYVKSRIDDYYNDWGNDDDYDDGPEFDPNLNPNLELVPVRVRSSNKPQLKTL